MNFRACLVLIAVLPLRSQGQRIERYELRGAADGEWLHVTIDGMDRLISGRAIDVWPGWTPQTLIYSEFASPGSQTRRLRWYDALTGNSYTIDTDDLRYEDVTTVRLSTGDYAILINLRDTQSHIPYAELATPNGGVFLREQFATYGTAANDHVEIRRYAPEDVERLKGKLELTTPSSISRAPLTPAAVPSAAGIYVATLPAADAPARNIVLNLRPTGEATLISQFEGKGDPIARKGSWSQQGAEISLNLNGDLTVWTFGSTGLTPKRWDRKLYGHIGLPLRKQDSVPVAR